MEIKLEVGDSVKVKKGFWKAAFDIMYCGMSNENTFVLSPHSGAGYQGFSPNVYYNKNSLNIKLLGLDISVIEVTQDYIIIGDAEHFVS